MTINVSIIMTIASIIGALTTIIGLILSIYKWILKQNEQDKKIEQLKKEIKQFKEENTLICFALSACLDGLQQLGANHIVPKAKDELDKYLNLRAHK